MAVPSSYLGDLLVANWTQALLLLPEVQEPTLPFQPCSHVDVEAFFKIRFPVRVVGIGLCTNFRMPFNADRRSREQSDYLHLSFLPLEDASEDPTIWSFIRKIFVFHPSARFVLMSATCPFPDGLEDGMVNGMKDRFTDDMAMIERPATNHRVEFYYQLACGQVTTFFDTFSDLPEKGLYTLLRRSDEELGAFSPAIFAYRLSQEIKPVFDMRDDGFLS